MMKVKNPQITKNDIIKKINLKLGVPNSFLHKIVDDLIFMIPSAIKEKKINIKNFGTFKSVDKKARIGRNPKNKKLFKIEARKSVSFIVSNDLNNRINK